MYLSVPSFPNPYSTTPLTNAYLYISVANFDFVAMSGRIEVAVYADAASAKANITPIARVSYPIPATTQDAASAHVLPPLSELIGGNQQLFNGLVSVFYGLVMADPRFAGATIVQETNAPAQ